MIRFARFLSWILHPLLMPTYGIALIFHYNAYLTYSLSPAFIKLIYAIVFTTTFILPTIITYFLVKKGWIKNFEMDAREERTLPFITTCICYSFGYFLLNRLYLPPIFTLLILGATAAVIIATFINLKWKISIHMIGIGGIVGAILSLSQKILFDFQLLIVTGLFAAGLLASARLMLQSHTPRQVYAGFFVGLGTGFIMLLL